MKSTSSKAKASSRAQAADVDTPSALAAVRQSVGPAAAPGNEAAATPPGESVPGGSNSGSQSAGDASEVPVWTTLDRDAFEAAFPLTFSMLTSATPTGAPLLRVRARTNGFRRAGEIHTVEGREFPLADLTPDQVEQMLAEPELTVEVV